MKQLDPRFIEAFTLRAGRLMKGIRHIQLLEAQLPDGMPAPLSITLTKLPFDLEVTWAAKDREHRGALKSRIAKLLKCSGKWYPYDEFSIRCRSKVEVGLKDTIKLSMCITCTQEN
jgi:hypothetical protein